MKNVIAGALALGAMVGSQSLSAETLRVTGVYPAGSDRAAALDTIAIEPFGGVDGPTLSIEIGDRLRAVRIEGDDWFRIVPASLSNDADAVMRGSVSTRVRVEDSYEKEKSVCAERDEDRKCVRRRKEKIPCDQLTVRVFPDIRVVTLDGDVAYSDSQEVTRELRFCADEDRPSADPLVDEAIGEIAGRARSRMAPSQRTSDVRVMETRKGMERDAGKSFRSAVRLTKTDEVGACAAFAALEPAIGEHKSLLFNLGLCAETADDFATATDYYQRTLAVDDGNDYAGQGLSRVRERERALAQLSSRYAE